MSMLVKSKDPIERYESYNLKEDQLYQLDMYVMKLKNGEAIDSGDIYDIKTENKILKE